jgi:hypothetical protein
MGLAAALADDDPHVIRPRARRARHFEKRPHRHADEDNVAELGFGQQRHRVRTSRTHSEKAPPAHARPAYRRRPRNRVDEHANLTRVDMATSMSAAAASRIRDVREGIHPRRRVADSGTGAQRKGACARVRDRQRFAPSATRSRSISRV